MLRTKRYADFKVELLKTISKTFPNRGEFNFYESEHRARRNPTICFTFFCKDEDRINLLISLIQKKLGLSADQLSDDMLGPHRFIYEFQKSRMRSCEYYTIDFHLCSEADY